MRVSLDSGAKTAQRGADLQVDLVELGQELLEADNTFGLFAAQID